MSKWLRILVAASVVGIAGSSFALSPAFDEIDANKDGRLSKAEAAVVKGLDFAKADANKDGSLDRSEYAAATG